MSNTSFSTQPPPSDDGPEAHTKRDILQSFCDCYGSAVLAALQSHVGAAHTGESEAIIDVLGHFIDVFDNLEDLGEAYLQMITPPLYEALEDSYSEFFQYANFAQAMIDKGRIITIAHGEQTLALMNWSQDD